MMPDLELRVRVATFEWLEEQISIHSDVLPRSVLAGGFSFEGHRVPLVGPQGIFKPSLLRLPLSITTSPRSPYHDHFGPGNLLRYAYRGTDPMHHENAGLREAMHRRLPLVYFHGLVPNEYLAAFPAYVVTDDPTGLFFGVAVDDARYVGPKLLREVSAGVIAESGDEPRRAYITAVFRRRLHQQSFRALVLRAYRERCSFCWLRHTQLLDAAHITADADPEGEPVVSNGLALCKLHHAAFDRYFLTVRPDYRIEVRRDVLDEEDGPMLLHGLKDMHLQRIHLPTSRAQHPDPERLARRYERFRAAG